MIDHFLIGGDDILLAQSFKIIEALILDGEGNEWLHGSQTLLGGLCLRYIV